MRSGMLPSQQRALRQAFKKADKFDHFRKRTRRSFLALGSLGLAGTIAGFWVGRSTTWFSGSEGAHDLEGRPVDPRIQSMLPWARELARGDERALVEHYVGFLFVFGRVQADEALWHGFHRLVEVAKRDANRPLATHLLESGRPQKSDATSVLFDTLQQLIK